VEDAKTGFRITLLTQCSFFGEDSCLMESAVQFNYVAHIFNNREKNIELMHIGADELTKIM
jgi:hypothetical protein